MWRLLVFTTLVALTTAFFMPSFRPVKHRVGYPYAHAINQFPYEENFEKRNGWDWSLLRAKNRAPKMEEQFMIYALESPEKQDVIDQNRKDMCLFVVDELIKQFPLLEDQMEEKVKVLAGFDKALQNTDSLKEDSVSKAKIAAGPPGPRGPAGLVEENVYTRGIMRGSPGLPTPMHHTATNRKTMNVEDTATIEKATKNNPWFLLAKSNNVKQALIDALDSVTKAKILAGPSSIVEEKVYTEGFPAGHLGLQTPLHHTATIKKTMNVEDAPLFNVPGIHKGMHRTATTEKAMHVNDAPLFNFPSIHKGRTRLVEKATENVPVFRLAKLNNIKLALIDVCNEF